MQTILITGSSSGYGRETARFFLANGWNVIATMRKPDPDVLPRSERLKILPLDVTRDDSIAARFRTYLKIHAGMSDGPPSTLTVRAWINPDGSVERVSFTAFKDEGATRDLQTILTRGNIGEAPPPEMLQPVNLRFSLRAR